MLLSPYLFCVLLLVAIVNVDAVEGASSHLVFWTGRGAAPNLWTDPLNWSSHRTPQPFDNVVISSNDPLDIEIPRYSSVEVQNLWIGSDVSSKTIKLRSYAPIHVADQLNILSSGELNVYSSDCVGGKAAVSGRLFLCNEWHNRINLTNIEAEKHGGVFEIVYLPQNLQDRKDENQHQFCQRFEPQRPSTGDSEIDSDFNKNFPFLEPELDALASSDAAVDHDSVFGAPLASNTFSITVPGTRGNQLLSSEEHTAFVNDITEKIARRFGGATIVPSEGAWISSLGGSDQSRLIREPVTSITVSADLNHEAKTFIKSLALDLLIRLEQEAIFVTLGRRSFLVT